MIVEGLRILINGSLAVNSCRARAAELGPSRIEPPTYAPLAFTQSNVVAVPKSIAMDGPLKSSRSARALRIRSAPTCVGVFTFNFRPTGEDGVMNVGLTANEWRIASDSTASMPG